MPREEMKKYLDILELGPSASLSDVKNAYSRLKKLYSEDSLALAPLADEFPEKKRKRILRQVEEAYLKLQGTFRPEPAVSVRAIPAELSPEEPVEKRSPVIDKFSGPALREIRERSGIKREEISSRLKLRTELLKNIEEENFGALPEAPYLKGHLKNLAGCLGLNPDRVADDYLKRYRERKS